MEQLRIALIGAGQIARTTHIPNLKEIPEAEIAGICDVCIETAQQAAEEGGISRYYGSHVEMIKEIRPDAVIVCVPNRYHFEMTLSALDMGCHVLCEKPPAITAEESEQMERKAKENRKLLSYGFHLRASEEVQLVREEIRRGALGEIYHAEASWCRRRGVPGWGNFTDKDIQGGGPLIDIGAHVLDSALYLMGYPEIAGVYASASSRIGRSRSRGLMGSWDPERFTVEDGLFGFIKFQNGSSLEIQTAFALNQKERDRRNIILYGSEQGAQVFPPELYGDEEGRLWDKALAVSGNRDPHLELDRNFVRACLGKEELLVKAEEGTYVQKLIEMLYQSAESGEPSYESL